MGFVSDIVGGLTGANQSSDAAVQASATQAAASQAGIDEQRRQFNALQKLMAPFVTGGTTAFNAQQSLLGLRGPEQEQAAIAGLTESPLYREQAAQAENSAMQAAAATGGLRGGNFQQLFANIRPQLLSQMVQQRFQNLGGLAGLGQASAAGQGSAGLQMGGTIADLYGQKGAAQAGGLLAAGNRQSNIFGQALQLGGLAAGLF